jgi:hypothetical protein
MWFCPLGPGDRRLNGEDLIAPRWRAAGAMPQFPIPLGLASLNSASPEDTQEETTAALPAHAGIQ